MAKVEQLINASPERVFAVLADAWTYSDWVVGSAHIRDADPEFPQVGSKFYHKVGPWPLSIKDESVVLECEPSRLLVLKVKMWPLGAGTVRFDLVPAGERTRVSMTEEFTEGPMLAARTKVNDLLLHGRNRESLRRLAELAVNRVPRPTNVR